MINLINEGLEWRFHEASGFYVREDGLIYDPKKNRYSYGKQVHHYKRVYSNYKTWLVHRLVAECFIPNPDRLPCVNHRDENTTNNDVRNLEWCTYSQNRNHSIRRRQMGIERPCHIGQYTIKREKSMKPVAQYTKDGVFVGLWSSQSELEAHGYTQSALSLVCNNKLKTHRGFVWRFVR